jgi:hypothetical protein
MMKEFTGGAGLAQNRLQYTGLIFRGFALQRLKQLMLGRGR